MTGKDSEADPEKNLTYNVVTSLSSGLSGKGYHIFCDNFYSSPELFSDLKKKGFQACGTVRMNRKGLPEAFKCMKCSKGKFVTLLLTYKIYCTIQEK